MTATATAPAATQANPVESLRRVVDDVTRNVLVERAAEMHVVTLGLLAGVNVNMLGPPGTAKSLGLRSISKRIVGARYFEKQFHAQMPADAIIGPYDMPRFAKTGEFSRTHTGYITDAHIGFADEWSRANGPTHDAMLSIANTQERTAEHNGGVIKIPLLALFMASNYMPDPEDAHLGAMVDRITLMLLVEYVKADDSFMELLERDHARRVAEASGSEQIETMTLDELVALQELTRLVAPTPDWKQKYAELRRTARGEGITVSDRRWVELGLVQRAGAVLAGRDFLIPEDIANVEHGLWRDKNDIPLAKKLVQPFKGRYEQAADKHRQEAAAPFAEVEQIRPLVEGTPPNEELDSDVMRRAINTNRAIVDVRKRVDQVLDEAKKEQRDVPALRDLQNELQAVQEWFRDNNLPHGLKN